MSVLRYRTPKQFEKEEGHKVRGDVAVFGLSSYYDIVERRALPIWVCGSLGMVRRVEPSVDLIVLAIEGEGPPPTDWTPGGK